MKQPPKSPKRGHAPNMIESGSPLKKGWLKNGACGILETGDFYPFSSPKGSGQIVQ
jgi:hypothetical protein